jgi:hypothetical protein
VTRLGLFRAFGLLFLSRKWLKITKLARFFRLHVMHKTRRNTVWARCWAIWRPQKHLVTLFATHPRCLLRFNEMSSRFRKWRDERKCSINASQYCRGYLARPRSAFDYERRILNFINISSKKKNISSKEDLNWAFLGMAKGARKRVKHPEYRLNCFFYFSSYIQNEVFKIKQKVVFNILTAGFFLFPSLQLAVCRNWNRGGLIHRLDVSPEFYINKFTPLPSITWAWLPS